ncbi:arginase family protein [Leifsonia sp. T36S-04]
MIRQLVQARRLAEAVRAAKAEGRFPLSSAGNCHTTLGVLAGLDDPDLGLIWFDAHSGGRRAVPCVPRWP